MRSLAPFPNRTHSGFVIPQAHGLARLEARSALRAPCVIRLSGQEAEPIAVLGETVNLSRTGIAVQVGAALPVGAVAEVELEGVGQSCDVLQGRIVHCRRVVSGTFEVGIETMPRRPAVGAPSIAS